MNFSVVHNPSSPEIDSFCANFKDTLRHKLPLNFAKQLRVYSPF